jgi:hypothetical protein
MHKNQYDSCNTHWLGLLFNETSAEIVLLVEFTFPPPIGVAIN